MASKHAEASPSPWTVEPRCGPSSAVPLMIFPHAGAGVTAYRRLAMDQAEVFRPAIVRLPGREQRLHEPLFRSMDALIRALVPALQPMLAAGPVLYGHSMGALVAFEVARYARDVCGVEPACLVVSGCAAPSTREPRRLRHLLSDDEFWRSVCELNGMPDEIARDRAMRDMLMPVFRADFEVCDTYAYSRGAALGCPIIAFAGDADQEALPAEMAAWAEETTGSFRHRTVPGDHFFNLDLSSRLSTRILSAHESSKAGGAGQQVSVNQIPARLGVAALADS
jgi:medium-chain acyl-[acyl-carrier-protein] hydrolase